MKTRMFVSSRPQQINVVFARKLYFTCPTIMGLLVLSTWQNVNAQQSFQQGYILTPKADPVASVPNPNASFLEPPPVEMESNEDFESYNRGPLHEAFATPSSDAPVEGIIVAKQPPELVNELIPEERPDGESVVWIPGYWSYDDDLDDFLWITGVWRDIPPGMRWVPGYWEEVEGGFRWVSGLWMPVETAEIEYVPNPPESLEIGPSSVPPAENYCWIPGNWAYVNTSYSWNPGYWAPPRYDYCWAPPRYIYTGRGCLFSPGYWDYAPYRRGLVFAPIRWFRPNRIFAVNYRPRIVINTWRNFYSTLFVRNRRGYYAYGNYFGPRFVDRGFVHLSFFNGNRRGFYDPLYNYNRARFGNTFTTQLTGWNSYFERHEVDRPRLTFREEIQLRQRQPERSRIVPFTIGNDLRQVVQKREAPLQITKINNEQLAVVNRVSNELLELSRERKQIETKDIKLIRNNLNDNNTKIGLPGLSEGKNKVINQDIVNKLPTENPTNNSENSVTGNNDEKLPGRDIARDNKQIDSKPEISRTKLNLANNKGLINEQIKQKELLIQEQANVRSRLKPTNNNPNDALPESIGANNIIPKLDDQRNNNVNVDANSRLRVKTGGTDPEERLSIKEKRELGNLPQNSISNLNPVKPETNNSDNSRVNRNNKTIDTPGLNSAVIKNPVSENDSKSIKSNTERGERGQGKNVGSDQRILGNNGSTEPDQRTYAPDSSRNNPRINRQDNSGMMQNNPTNIPGISPPNQTINNSGIKSGGIKEPTSGEIRRMERQAPPPAGNSNPGNTRNNGVPNAGSIDSSNSGTKIQAPKNEAPKTPSSSEVRRMERQNTPPPATTPDKSSSSNSPPRESRPPRSSESNSNGRAESRKKEK